MNTWNLFRILAKGTTALLLAGAILWQVALRAGVGLWGCEAVIHVSETEVVVTVDGSPYWVESVWDTPIVCTLAPGRHTLRMLRSGQVLYEQEFTLDAGQEIVLTAWDQARPDLDSNSSTASCSSTKP